MSVVPRNRATPDTYVQIVNRKGKQYIRAMPYTAINPTKNQVRVRIAFGEAARKAKGSRFTGQLPPSALAVKNEMKGMYYGRTVKYPKWMYVLGLV